MARRIQRVVKDNSDKVLKPPDKDKDWVALTPIQRTRGRRMMNDPYQLWKFPSLAGFMDALTKTPLPAPAEKKWRKSGYPKTSGSSFGLKDPLLAYHGDDASGGLLIEETDSTKTKDIGNGSHFAFGDSAAPASNWASFVNLHYHGAMRKLMDAGLYTGATKTELQRLHAKAIKHADVMDNLEVGKHDKFVASTDGDVWSGIAVENQVNAMWDLAAAGNPLARAQYPNAKLPLWGQLHTGGMGTRVEATFAGDRQSIVAGSKADKKNFRPPWLEKIDGRLGYQAVKSEYVLGHLLNDNLGGPSLAYNIVPLTATANSSHLSLVEAYVKERVLEMRKQAAIEAKHSPIVHNRIARVWYRVEAEYGTRKRRRATGEWEDAVEFLSEVVSNLSSHAGFKATMSVQDFRDELHAGTFAKRKAAGKPLDAKAWGKLQWCMNGVAEDRDNVSVAEAQERIEAIAEIWVKEEKYTPTKLVCDAKTFYDDNVGDDEDSRIEKRSIENQIGLFVPTQPGRR